MYSYVIDVIVFIRLLEMIINIGKMIIGLLEMIINIGKMNI